MLIEFYNPIEHKTFNNTEIIFDNAISLKWKNLEYPTNPLTLFDNINKEEIFILIEDQLSYVKKEADTLLKYNMLSKKAYDLTMEQYKVFLYFNGCFYKKDELKLYLSKQESEFNTYIIPQEQTVDKHFEEVQQITTTTKNNNKETIEISRTAIRNITGYSPYFTPTRRNGETVYVERQDRLIEDETKNILVLGSRQIGKSYSLSEKAVEESHIPNNDILVGAFTAKSTSTIRNNIRKFINKFPEGYFIERIKDNYILNTQTGSKINFATLSDTAVDSVRGMTLNTILVDEAQLVSEYAYLEVLKPTLATTGGKMVLIGTPPKVPTGYFVEQIFKFKRGESKRTSFYEIKITDQPFTHPDDREEVMESMNEPRIQRERFCNLTTDVDQLFKIPLAEEFPKLNRNCFYVLGIDPARLGDRSGYSVNLVSNGKITTIESGFVSDTFKKEWKMQVVFFKKIKEKYEKFNEMITVMDVSGVGDGVYSIFQEAGFKIHYTIRYTAGNIISNKLNNYTVSKSVLINTMLDFITENQIEIVDITNKYLLEELKYIYETESRSGLIGFTSKFFDDITNSLMINCFIIKIRKLLSKTPQTENIFKESSGNPLIDGIEGLGNQANQLNSMW